MLLRCHLNYREVPQNFLSSTIVLVSAALLFPSDFRATKAAKKSDFASVGADNCPSAQSLEEGWISLFDGKTLFGWKAHSYADWHVSDGVVIATEGGEGLLRTTSQFSDFELSVDFKTTVKTNSGIFARTSPVPKNPATDCYEINIAPQTDPFPTGSVVGRKRAQALALTADQWHTMRIIVNHDVGTCYLNGEHVNHFSTADLGRGYIGLQFQKGKIQFRNIFLKPINLKPLLTGNGLKDWITDQSGETTFTFDGAENLQMKSGPGQLESKQHFADCVIRATIKTNAEGLNSGIFFRCIPGEKMNGYESQIQNQMIDGDPSRPFDCGTGGIFRRQNARRIVAQDKQWFHKTIVAVGPHISVWVNGYQVTDWTDKRKPDANPRRGLRLEAGSIMLQGHDPTTDILIRQINAAELLDRRRRR